MDSRSAIMYDLNMDRIPTTDCLLCGRIIEKDAVHVCPAVLAHKSVEGLRPKVRESIFSRIFAK